MSNSPSHIVVTPSHIAVTPSHIVFLLMLSMLVGMKDSNVKFLINDLAACQDKKKTKKNLDLFDR